MKGEVPLFSPEFWPFIDGEEVMRLLRISATKLKYLRITKKISTYSFEGTGKYYYNVLEIKNALWRNENRRKNCCCSGCKLVQSGMYKLPVPWLPNKNGQ